jgi:predicted dehydrogenase
MKINRRNFIQNIGMAGVGMSLGAFDFAQKISANDTVNVGIIGTGDRGTGLATYLQNISNIRVTAVCDLIPFRLEKALSLADANAKSYSDYRKLLENKDLDAVIIATPFGLHAQMAMAAISAEKHIFCEKTMTRGFADTQKLLKKARQSKKIFQTGHQYHHSRLYLYVVEMIKKGYIGDIAAFECQWNRNHNWRRDVPDPKWERLINWRMYREFSGGLVAELCSHQIDLINWITNSHPLQVMGMGSIDFWKDGRETYDNVHLMMEYPQGIKAKFTCLTTNALEDYRVKILGNKGTIVLDYTRAWAYIESRAKKELGVVDGVSGATLKAWEEGKSIPIEVDHSDPSLEALADFRDNIQQNKMPISNVETGAKVSYIVQMANDAMDKKRVEVWKKEFDL